MFRSRVARWATPALLSLVAVAPLGPVSAATYDVQIDSAVTFVPSLHLVNQASRIYSSILNTGTEDMEGVAFFSDNGEQISVKPYSAKAGGRAEEVWAQWVPKTVGNHVIRIDATADGSVLDATPDNNTRQVTVFVDVDTDGDGIGDSLDPDDDNDGVPDNQDQFPLDPNRSKDTDGDGIDDSKDSDDDNDGLYDHEEETLHTNPLKRDTDGDGVGDKEDAFPLDPKKSKPDVVAVVPPPAPTPEPSAGGSDEARVLGVTDAAPAAGQGNQVQVAVVGSEDANASGTWQDIPGTEVAVVTTPEPEPTVPPAPPAPSSEGSSWLPILWGVAGASLLAAFTFFFLARRRKSEEEPETEMAA